MTSIESKTKGLNQSGIGGKLRENVFDKHALHYICRGQANEGEIVIGLDFGTSASKVVIQIAGFPGNPAFAVDFGEMAHQSMRYLIPTRLCVTSNNVCTLPDHRIQMESKIVNDIKLELFTKNEQMRSNHGPTRQGLSPETTAVAYLALVLRRAREWFLGAKKDIIGHLAKLNWSLNLGVPSPCIESNEENHRFERVGKAAWILSLLDEEITILKAEAQLQVLANTPNYWEGNELACNFQIIPEIAAGAVGYASSPQRREGLHLMIDIGASTVDICSFVLHDRDGIDRYSLLVADVQEFGTIRLHQDRVQAILKAYQSQAQDLRDKHDPVLPIPDNPESYILSKDRFLTAISEAEKELKKQCQLRLSRMIADLRRKRDPNSPAWRGKLPILLIGGGCQLKFFRTLVEEMNSWVASYIVGSEGTVVLPVIVPQSVSKIEMEQRRLAVAWGLSHQHFNIGQIIPADKIDDIPPLPTRDIEDRFIGKEQT